MTNLAVYGYDHLSRIVAMQNADDLSKAYFWRRQFQNKDDVHTVRILDLDTDQWVT